MRTNPCPRRSTNRVEQLENADLALAISDFRNLHQLIGGTFCSSESAAWRIESTAAAAAISLRMRFSIEARSASTRARSAAHLAASRPPVSKSGT